MTIRNMTKAFACAAVAALATAGLAPRASAGVPSGNLPLIRDGLAVHLDASDTSTMTLDAEHRVLEWRSKVGTVKFAQAADQNVLNLPYWKENINLPSTAQVPGVVFGVVPGYEYGTTAAGAENCVRSWMNATETIASKEVFLVMVNHPRTGGYGSDTVIPGQRVCNVDGYFYQTGGSASRGIVMYGTQWSVGIMSADDYMRTTGLAWLNGTKVVDWPNNYYRAYTNKQGVVTMHGLSFTESTLYTLDAVGDATFSNVGVPVLGRSDVYSPSMDLCEVAVYNHALTDDERAYVTTALQNKWQKKIACVEWTGAAGDGKWSTARNWSGNAVPTASDTVAISLASVTVDADAVCGYLAAVGATITIAEGKRFDVGLGLIDGATINGSGTLKLADKPGATALPSGLTLGSGLTLQVGSCSTLDLNGKNISLVSLTGGRPVTNSANTMATLTLGAARDGVLDAALLGNISLVKQGADTEIEVSAAQANTGETVLEGGALTGVKKLVVDAIPGCVIHVDASRRDTLTVDADGRVTAWQSTVDPDDSFYLASTNENMSVKSKDAFLSPTYQATGVNGKLPAVRFGSESKNSTMKLGATGRTVDVFKKTHRTVFIVDCPQITGSNTVVPYGKQFLGSGGTPAGYPYPILRFWKDGNTSYDAVSPWAGGAAEIYRNGQKVPTMSKGAYMTYFEFAAASVVPRCNYPHVICVTIPEAAQSDNDTFRPVLGGLGFGSYNDNGGYAGTAFMGDICELIVFDRYLAEDERQMVATYLVNKWIEEGDMVPPPEWDWPAVSRFDNVFSSASELVLRADTVLTQIGAQTFCALTVDASGGASMPRLMLSGDIDLSGMTLNLLGVRNVALRSPFLSTDATLSGTFSTITGMEQNFEVSYDEQNAYFCAHQGFMVIVW